MNLIEILYEDNEIYIINKPAGLSVQGGEKITHSLDVDFSLQVHQKIHLVHRLDKDTSGLMIVAKNSSAASKWTKLIGGKSVKKEYLALCTGQMKKKSGTISEIIEQHGREKNAFTNYTVLKEWDDSDVHFLLLRLCLDTGRMHQIRIHLGKNGCPIAGDDLHGNFKINKILRKSCGIKKLCLASVKLSFPKSLLDGFENSKEDFFIEIPCPFLLPEKE